MNDTVILIPYFKRYEAIIRTLSSIRDEIPEFDVLIVDDGSPIPLTIDASQYPFPLKIIRMTENKGIEHALNTGLMDILSSSYDFVARLDTGDYWVSGRLSAQRNFLLQHPDHGIVGCCASVFNSDNTLAFELNLPLTDEKVRKFINFNSAFTHTGAMIRTSIIRDAGLYSDQFEAAEDYEYFRRLLTVTKGANLPERWVEYELGMPGESISIDKYRLQIKSVIKAQLKYFNPLEWRAYAGLIYKILHLYTPPIAGFLKRNFRRLAV
jgi:glycosyltransferase involved in cell wall biosynthesis